MAKLDRLVASGIPLDDARTLVSERALADHLDAAAAAYPAGLRGIANWIVNEPRAATLAPAHLAGLVRLVDDAVISGKIAKDVLGAMLATGDAPDVIVEREGLRQITDTGAIEALARDIVAKNPKQAEQFRSGKEGVLGFFVGQLMKASGGKANPQLASDLLRKILAE